WVGRTSWQGMSSRAILEDNRDQRAMSSLMRSGGRSGPRSRPTPIRYAPRSRSCLIGQRNRLWPMCSSPSCPVHCQLSSVATQLSNGTSIIRGKDSQRTAPNSLQSPVADDFSFALRGLLFHRSGALIRGCRILISRGDPPLAIVFSLLVGAGCPLRLRARDQADSDLGARSG